MFSFIHFYLIKTTTIKTIKFRLKLIKPFFYHYTLTSMKRFFHNLKSFENKFKLNISTILPF